MTNREPQEDGPLGLSERKGNGGVAHQIIATFLSELRQNEETAAIYKRADELLYAAKRGGRNRVMA